MCTMLWNDPFEAHATFGGPRGGVIEVNKDLSIGPIGYMSFKQFFSEINL